MAPCEVAALVQGRGHLEFVALVLAGVGAAGADEVGHVGRVG